MCVCVAVGRRRAASELGDGKGGVPRRGEGEGVRRWMEAHKHRFHHRYQLLLFLYFLSYSITVDHPHLATWQR